MMGRVEVEGRHLRLNGERFVVRGTAYGRFAPRTDGARYPEPPRLRADLESIAATGLNTIRTFDVPPPDLLNAAAEVGLRVFVGLDYPDWRFEPFPDRTSGQRIAADGLAAVDRLIERIDDPAVVLAVSVGQALPADLVRVHHPVAVADTLAAIVDRIHTVDPSLLATYTGCADDGLVTLDGCDVQSIMLDSECGRTFERDLVFLQQTRPARPLVVTDLDPPSAGPTAVMQARDLANRLDALDRSGCAGAVVATWAGEFAVAEGPADPRSTWLVTSEAALNPLGRCVETWARQDVKDLRRAWPRVTALVRADNSESTIERCLSALELSDYHDLEVIVCDEGSTDRTLELASRYPFETLQPDHPDGGSVAAGLAAASGEIVAFLDADMVCHRLWPFFIALAFDSTDPAAAVTQHLVEAGEGETSVARAMAALADLDRLPPTDPSTAITAGLAGLAVRRSTLRRRDLLSSDSTMAPAAHLVQRIGAQPGDSVATAPAAQAVRHAPDNLGAVWRDAVSRGSDDRHVAELSSTGDERPRRSGIELLSAALVGDRPSRAVALCTLLDDLVPLLAVTAAIGVVVAAAGATGAGLLLAGGPVIVAGLVAAVIAHDVATTGRSGARARSPRIGPAVAVIVVLEPLAHTWGRLRTRPRPTAPPGRSWTGDREEWLKELRWRLARAQLSVFAPASRRCWDIEVRCGLFLRQLIVAAVAWQWTPHVRTALRPRRMLILPVVAVAATWPWSPLIAAFIASATMGELVFELITLRRVDQVISRSITGSLPTVRPTGEPEVELAASSTPDL